MSSITGSGADSAVILKHLRFLRWSVGPKIGGPLVAGSERSIVSMDQQGTRSISRIPYTNAFRPSLPGYLATRVLLRHASACKAQHALRIRDVVPLNSLVKGDGEQHFFYHNETGYNVDSLGGKLKSTFRFAPGSAVFAVFAQALARL